MRWRDCFSYTVIPAKAGIFLNAVPSGEKIPACAGMTKEKVAAYPASPIPRCQQIPYSLSMELAPTLSDDTDAEPPHPYRWTMLGGVWLLYFAFALAIASMAPLVYRLLAALGMDRAEMGTVLAAWQLTYIFSSVPCGGLLDRFGPRRIMFASILVIAASVALRATSDRCAAPLAPLRGALRTLSFSNAGRAAQQERRTRPL